MYDTFRPIVQFVESLNPIFIHQTSTSFTYQCFFVARISRILHLTNEDAEPDRFGLFLLCKERNTVILITVSVIYISMYPTLI
jgi:hypothetical protein